MATDFRQRLRGFFQPRIVEDPQRRTGYFYFAAQLLTIFGIALSNAFLGLMILWSGWRRRLLDWSWERHRALLAPLGALAIFYVTAVLFSFDPGESRSHLKSLLPFAAVVLAPLLVRGEQEVRRIMDFLLGLITLLALHGSWQYYFTEYGTLHKRIVGGFSHVQTFSGVLLLGALLLSARIFTGRGWRRPWLWAALAVIVWTLFLTLTRGAWVALAVTLLVYLSTRAKRYLVAAAAVAMVAALLVPAVRERMASIVDLREESNYDRLAMIDAGLYMVGERPWTGLGPGMVKERYPIYRHPTAPRFTVPHLHNAFLDLAAEGGLPLLASYLWLMGTGLVLAWRGYRREGGRAGPRADLYLGVALGLFGFLVAGLFENNWGDSEVQRIVLFLLAIPLCLRESPACLRESPAENESDG